MDLTPFLIRSPSNHAVGDAKNILVEYGVRPAQKEGTAAYDRAFTEETCILVALVNGFDRVVVLNYPHKSHFKNGVHEPHQNHITAAFGHRGDKIEKAHIYLSEIRPYLICRRKEDEKIDVVWGGHLGYTFEPVLSFNVQAWLDPLGGTTIGLKWEIVRMNQVRRKLKTTGILSLRSWRTDSQTAPTKEEAPKEDSTQADCFAYGMGKGLRHEFRSTITSERQKPTLGLSCINHEPSMLSLPFRSRSASDNHKTGKQENITEQLRVNIVDEGEQSGKQEGKKNRVEEAKEDKKSTLAEDREEGKENNGIPKRQVKLGRLPPLQASRNAQNWRDTMSPLPSVPGTKEREDPWRQLERLCNDLASIPGAKGKENWARKRSSLN